jgi:hypothetical protein
MKTIAGSVIAAALLLGVTPAFGGEKDLASAVPQYNTKTEVEFRGTILKVDEIAPGNSFAGVHLTIQTKTNATFDVFLGPADFIKLMKMPFRPGVKDVGVTGSKVTFEGKEMVLAREVRIDNIFLTLRDEKGFPNWLWAVRTDITSGGF